MLHTGKVLFITADETTLLWNPNDTTPATFEDPLNQPHLTPDGAVALRQARVWGSRDLHLGCLASDRHGQLVERDGHPPIRGLLDRQLVVASPKILNEGMAGNDQAGVSVLLEPAHRL
jgi:hypothetical protein